jgi:sec-independent protein translocase protein TatB
MFDHLGWSELIVLAIVGLIVFGPERLPKAAADLARLVRQLRGMAQNATADLKAELGPEMADLDLTSLHPRRFVQSVWDDDVPRPRATQTLPPLTPGEKPPYDIDAT